MGRGKIVSTTTNMVGPGGSPVLWTVVYCAATGGAAGDPNSPGIAIGYCYSGPPGGFPYVEDVCGNNNNCVTFDFVNNGTAASPIWGVKNITLLPPGTTCGS